MGLCQYVHLCFHPLSLQHSEAAVHCLGRHFLILYAHTKSCFQTKDHGHWSGSETILVHSWQYTWLAQSFPPVALGKAYELHVSKALPTCSYTKLSLLTALVNCKARMVSCQHEFSVLQLVSRHDNWIMKLVSQGLVGRAVGPSSGSSYTWNIFLRLRSNCNWD